MSKLKISVSRIKAWRRCHMKHFYKFIMQIQRKKPGIALFKGSIMHDMCEAFLSGGNWKRTLKEYEHKFNKLFAAERELHGDLPADMKRIMEGYIEHWRKDKLKYLKVEEREEFPILKDVLFTYQVDAVVRDTKKREWLLERKTPKKFPEENVRMSDIQTILYVWARNEAGYKTHGILWDYVRSKPPREPELLKRGGLSVAQNIDTDYNTYLNAIKKYKLNPKDYAEKLESLKGSEHNFYRRVYMAIPPESVMKTIVRDAIDTAREIKANPESKTRTLAFDCNGCEFYELCQAELRGIDTDFILKSQYEKSTYEGLSNESQTEEE